MNGIMKWGRGSGTIVSQAIIVRDDAKSTSPIIIVERGETVVSGAQK